MVPSLFRKRFFNGFTLFYGLPSAFYLTGHGWPRSRCINLCEISFENISNGCVILNIEFIEFHVKASFTSPMSEEEMGAGAVQTRIIFVVWSDPATLWGRETHIDKSDRIVFSKGHKDEHPMMYYDGATIIVNAIGVMMHKFKSSREKVPPDIMKIKDMYEAALLHKDELGTHKFAHKHDLCLGSFHACAVCGLDGSTATPS